VTLDVVPATGDFTGTSHIDLAVRHDASPIGAWTIFKIDDENDGTNNQPNHGCTDPGAANGLGPCFGDYPHIGADANGFYITTNEYSFFGPEFKSAKHLRLLEECPGRHAGYRRRSSRWIPSAWTA